MISRIDTVLVGVTFFMNGISSMVGIEEGGLRSTVPYLSSKMYLSVCLHVDRTYVSLKHGVVLFLSTQALLQNSNVLLIILMLFF